MRQFVKAKKGEMTAAQFSGPTKISPELLAIFRGAVISHNNELELHPELRPPVREPKREPTRTNRKHTLKTGAFFGHLILRRKAAPLKGAKPTLRERWNVECLAKTFDGRVCGNKLVVPKYYLTRPGNPKTHCGCQFETLKSRHQREYRIYHMMHQRVLNPKHESYEHYKKRGITIYEPWQKHNEDGFELWLKEVGPAPTPAHSLDRIRNADGYVPGNIKWSTASEQRINQGDLIGGKTQEEIAAMNMTEDEWVAHTRIHGYV